MNAGGSVNESEWPARAPDGEGAPIHNEKGGAEKVAENMGGGLGGDGGNLIGTMIGMGMVNPLANQMGNIMQGNTMNTTPQANASNDNDEIFEDLKKLGELKAAGILTEEEFNDKKKELLTKIK